MTRLFEEAFKKASELPETEQDSLAKWLLKDLESEREWDRLFAQSQDVLDRLAHRSAGDSQERRNQPHGP